MEVELVPISWLKPHEEVKPSNVDSLHDITLRWNAYTKPLLVDGRTGTILDGHHRYHVGLRIGLLAFRSSRSTTWMTKESSWTSGQVATWRH